MSTPCFALAVLLVLAASPVDAAPAGVIDVRCECTESEGGGGHRYQYTLRASGGPVTLQRFRVGTQDLDPASYSGWEAPPGFAARGTPTSSSVLPTSLLQTPHGARMPHVPPVPSAGEIVWTGSVTIPPGATVTFGFDHPFPPWDAGWDALTRIVAGRSGVFGEGQVHAPAPGWPRAAAALTGWGLAALGFLSLAAIALELSSRWRSAGRTRRKGPVVGRPHPAPANGGSRLG